MIQISLLGCGWLGLPLAKSLLEKGFLVKGSTTSEDKLPVLKTAGIRPFLISLGGNEIGSEIDLFLQNSEILIIAIPPKLRSDASKSFVAKIQNLLPFIENSSVKKVLFVSSTSVYGDDNSTITEATKPHPTSENGKQLVASELLLQNNKNFKTTIVRFGGLIGKDRHPIAFLSGRKNIENPEAPINLIHQEDCIGIIENIIEKDCWDETFNAVAPFHPTRKEYYTQKAIERNLPLPEFDESKPSVGKTISNNKVETILNYQFKNKL
jgi:nucleoside-diphosphate-sugar epimerase